MNSHKPLVYSESHRVIFAAWLGWLMDGYVSISYLIQASVVSVLFFPGSFSIGYFLAFGVNGIARAIGSILLGNFIGDRIGRKKMLVVSVGLFSISTASLGILPTYREGGIAVSITVFILLFLMGIFAGAEYGGGTALSMESVPPEKRNLYGAFVQSGFGFGYLILSGVFAFLSAVYGPSYSIIGWRVLFLSTLIPGALTFLIRAFTPESQVFEETEANEGLEKTPVVKLFQDMWGKLAIVVAITAGLLYINTSTFSLYPYILGTVNGFGGTTIGLLLLVVNLISVVGVILGGLYAGRNRNRIRFILLYTLIFLAVSVPVDIVAFGRNVITTGIAFSIQAFVEAMIFSTLPAFMSEAFSKKYRTTAVGLAYNLGSTFGAFAIVIAPLSAIALGWPVAWISNLLIAGIVLFGAAFASVYAMSSRAGKENVDMILE
ncbi:MAG: MFS transporter [Thermoplasmata archaeon]|nr:MFS transporter [Candidatus Sysuiplasma jiujiangense]